MPVRPPRRTPPPNSKPRYDVFSNYEFHKHHQSESPRSDTSGSASRREQVDFIRRARLFLVRRAPQSAAGLAEDRALSNPVFEQVQRAAGGGPDEEEPGDIKETSRNPLKKK
jgi:hypothetical protein